MAEKITVTVTGVNNEYCFSSWEYGKLVDGTLCVYTTDDVINASNCDGSTLTEVINNIYNRLTGNEVILNNCDGTPDELPDIAAAICSRLLELEAFPGFDIYDCTGGVVPAGDLNGPLGKERYCEGHPGSANIVWDTGYPTTSQIFMTIQVDGGGVPINFIEVYSDLVTMQTWHDIIVPTLAVDTIHYFYVRSVDQWGQEYISDVKCFNTSDMILIEADNGLEIDLHILVRNLNHQINPLMITFSGNYAAPEELATETFSAVGVLIGTPSAPDHTFSTSELTVVPATTSITVT